MKTQVNNVKMTLENYYKSLPRAVAPKTLFINTIIERCGVTQQAIHRWLRKGAMPANKEHCDIVAEIAGVSPEELFPLYKEKFLNNEKH